MRLNNRDFMLCILISHFALISSGMNLSSHIVAYTLLWRFTVLNKYIRRKNANKED